MLSVRGLHLHLVHLGREVLDLGVELIRDMLSLLERMHWIAQTFNESADGVHQALNFSLILLEIGDFLLKGEEVLAPERFRVGIGHRRRRRWHLHLWL